MRAQLSSHPATAAAVALAVLALAFSGSQAVMMSEESGQNTVEKTVQNSKRQKVKRRYDEVRGDYDEEDDDEADNDQSDHNEQNDHDDPVHPRAGHDCTDDHNALGVCRYSACSMSPSRHSGWLCSGGGGFAAPTNINQQSANGAPCNSWDQYSTINSQIARGQTSGGAGARKWVWETSIPDRYRCQRLQSWPQPTEEICNKTRENGMNLDMVSRWAKMNCCIKCSPTQLAQYCSGVIAASNGQGAQGTAQVIQGPAQVIQAPGQVIQGPAQVMQGPYNGGGPVMVQGPQYVQAGR